MAPREVFRSERREAFSEFILPVNTPLLVKAVNPAVFFVEGGEGFWHNSHRVNSLCHLFNGVRGHKESQ